MTSIWQAHRNDLGRGSWSRVCVCVCVCVCVKSLLNIIYIYLISALITSCGALYL